MTTQASQLSPDDQRTATDQALVRIAELEQQLVNERARADHYRERNAVFLRALGLLWRAFKRAECARDAWQRRAERVPDLGRTVDALRDRLKQADEALAAMVNQYMCYSEGYISHEFMGAQEDAIEYLTDIGWLRYSGLERYYWTPASGRGTDVSLAQTQALAGEAMEETNENT